MLVKSLCIGTLTLLLSIFSAHIANAQQLHLIAVNYAPLCYSQNGTIGGVAVETVQHIQKRVADKSPMTLLPWSRAYKLSQEKPAQGIFPLVRLPKRESLYKWVGPVFSEGDYFFKHKDNPIKIRTLEDAKNVSRIAVRKDTYPHILLTSKGFTNLDVGQTYEASYRKLANRRVDLVFLGSNTFQYMVKGQDIDPSVFEQTEYLIETSSAWIGFSPDVPDDVIATWQKALDAMKEDGTHDMIMKKYFTHLQNK